MPAPFDKPSPSQPMDQKPIIIDSDDDDEDQQPPQRQAPAPAQVSPAKVDQLDDDEDEEQHARRFDETNILGLNSFPVFFAGNQLTPQKFGSKTLEDLFAMYTDETIILQPDYQRGVVWNEKDQQDLIDSLFKGYHVPELVFKVQMVEVEPGEEGVYEENGRQFNKQWICVDGQQRMTTIFRFMEGAFAAIDDNGKKFVFRRCDSTPPGAIVMDRVPKEIFQNKKLRYSYFKKITDVQERALFRKIQKGKRLTPAEIGNALHGEWARYVKGLYEKYDKGTPFFPRICNIAVKKQNAFNLISIWFEEGLDNLKLFSPAAQELALSSRLSPSAENTRRFTDIVDRLLRLALLKRSIQTHEDDKWTSVELTKYNKGTSGIGLPHQALRPLGRTVSPVEFAFLPLLLHKFATLEDGKMLELIEKFRAHVFQRHKGEIKFNSKVLDTLKEWTESFDVRTLLGKYDNQGKVIRRDPTNANAVASGSGSGAARPAAVASSTTTKKTKRSTASRPTSESSSSDSSDEPLAKRAKALKTKTNGSARSVAPAPRPAPPPPPPAPVRAAPTVEELAQKARYEQQKAQEKLAAARAKELRDRPAHVADYHSAPAPINYRPNLTTNPNGGGYQAPPPPAPYTPYVPPPPPPPRPAFGLPSPIENDYNGANGSTNGSRQGHPSSTTMTNGGSGNGNVNANGEGWSNGGGSNGFATRLPPVQGQGQSQGQTAPARAAGSHSVYNIGRAPAVVQPRAPLPAPQQQQQQQQPPQPPYQFTSTIFGNKIYQPELAGSAPPGKASDPRIRR